MTTRWRSRFSRPTASACFTTAENGQDIPWQNRREGFSDGYLNNDDDEWRFLQLTTGDGRYRIVVGQEWDYRREMALDIVTSQLTPWLVALPLMFLLLIVLLSRELAPLKQLAQNAASARAGLGGIA